MKRIFTYIAIMLLSMSALYAQEKKGNGWKEKMKSEKIAFLTNEMNLSPEEAQVFWPVYNAAWEEKDNMQRSVMHAYKALDEAVKENKGEKEISDRLDTYLNLLDEQASIARRHGEQFKKVISKEKVARLYLAEEKFRREQIHKLHQGGRGPQQ